MKKAMIFFDSNSNKNQYYVLLAFIFLALWITGVPFTARAALRINSVTPDHGGRSENTALTINGEGFSSGDRVVIWGGGTYVKASHATKGPANALDCSGSYVYLACGTGEDPNSQGVQIFDIQDPNIPQPIHFFSLPEIAYDIHVIGNYAYVATSGAGLHILNVQDPLTPSLVSSLPLPGMALNLSVYGTYLYMAADNKGLYIMDISNPSSPEIKGSCLLPQGEFVVDVIAEGNYAYLAAGGNGLKIIDISDPNNPCLSGSFDENFGHVYSLYKRFNYLYLSEYNNGVEILDVSNPSAPELVSNITTLENACQVFIEGNYLYVADGSGGIKIFNHDPQNCTMIGFQKAFGWVEDLQVFDRNIFIANYDKGLQILDAKNPRNPSIASIADLKGNSELKVAGLHLQGDYLYVFSKGAQNWLKVLDISNPQNPWVRGTNDDEIGSDPEDLVARSGYAYLVDSKDGLEVFRVGSGGYPARIKDFTYYSYINDTSGGLGIFLKEDMLFVADSKEESGKPATTLKVFSLGTDPRDPFPVNELEIDPNYSTEAISAMGDNLVLAKGRGGLEIFSILDPNQPSQESGITFNNGNIKDIFISGDYVYLADETEDIVHGFLRTVNITDPNIPEPSSCYITTGKPQSLTLSENYLYLAEELAGIEIVDVAEPESPRLVASLPTLTRAKEVVSDGAEYVYLAMENGIMAIRALRPCPEDPLCINETTLTVSTPMGLAAGTYNISVAGPDGSLAVLPNGFTIEGNRPPVFEEPIFTKVMFLFEGDDFTFPIIASDPDGDSLSYSASLSVLTGASLEGNVFSWTPIVGQYPDVIFTVSDGEFTVEQKTTIMVEKDPDPNTVTNSFPELFFPLSPQAGKEGIAISFLVMASDSDTEDLTTLEISMLNAPLGAELQPLGIQENKMTAWFFWTPTYQQGGDYTITFIAKDQHLSEDQEIVSFHIQEVSSSPVVVMFQKGVNFWLCPAGRSDYSSFDFLNEQGQEAIYSLHAYDWNLSLPYSSYWFFGKPSGGNFSMDKSLLYVIYTKKEISFNWPLNL